MPPQIPFADCLETLSKLWRVVSPLCWQHKAPATLHRLLGASEQPMKGSGGGLALHLAVSHVRELLVWVTHCHLARATGGRREAFLAPLCAPSNSLAHLYGCAGPGVPRIPWMWNSLSYCNEAWPHVSFINKVKILEQDSRPPGLWLEIMPTGSQRLNLPTSSFQSYSQASPYPWPLGNPYPSFPVIWKVRKRSQWIPYDKSYPGLQVRGDH